MIHFFYKKGYAQLLQSLPRLQSVGRCDAFGQVLEYLKTYNLDPITLAIKFFHSRDVSYDQLKLMTDMCPDLIHVSLYVDEDAGNLLGMHIYRFLTLFITLIYSDPFLLKMCKIILLHSQI